MSDETAIGPVGTPDGPGHSGGGSGEQSPLQARAAFLKTGVGYLKPATPEDRAQEEARSEALIERLKKRAAESAKRGKQNQFIPPKA
jgi:hypothetical protein